MEDREYDTKYKVFELIMAAGGILFGLVIAGLWVMDAIDVFKKPKES